jgi:hypothetical protein
VAELVDAHDSKSCSARSGGSIPSTGTTKPPTGMHRQAIVKHRPAIIDEVRPARR